jgi:hypothetical protein
MTYGEEMAIGYGIRIDLICMTYAFGPIDCYFGS